LRVNNTWNSGLANAKRQTPWKRKQVNITPKVDPWDGELAHGLLHPLGVICTHAVVDKRAPRATLQEKQNNFGLTNCEKGKHVPNVTKKKGRMHVLQPSDSGPHRFGLGDAVQAEPSP
jgi:hypothetical protein